MVILQGHLCVKSNVFKIHLFHAKCSSNLLKYLLTYRSRFTDVKVYLNNIWSTSAQYTFLNIKPKMCFTVTIDEDCMIF